MLSKYLSHWLISYFILWFLGYIFNINIIIKYINPYYISIVSFVGYALLLSYYIFIKKYKYEYSLLFIKIVTHTLPLILSYYLIKDKNKYALNNLIVIVISYLIYTIYINRNIYNTYFANKPPTNWKDYFNLCKGSEGKYIPFCFLFKDT